jgi:hypothetical protein
MDCIADIPAGAEIRPKAAMMKVENAKSSRVNRAPSSRRTPAVPR